jgi:hypothetical protein
MSAMTTRLAAALGLGLCFVGLGGCHGGSRASYVTQYPQWAYEQYQRLAVLPGRASTPQGVRAAGLMADRLTTQLAQNGAFTVLSRAELREVFAEQDLSRLADDVERGTALPEGQLKIAQALVAAKITDYKLIDERRQQTIARYAVDRRGIPLRDPAGRRIIVGQDVVWVYTRGAEVEASVRVIDAATGKILLSHTARVAPRPRTSRNQPSSRTPEEMAEAAVQELAVEFYKIIAPTRTRVKLKGDMLVIATDYFDGQYETVKKVPRALTEFIVAVRNLPETCERNQFRVAIAAETGRENLFEQEFVWSGSAGPEGISFRVPLETLISAGADKFLAKIYSDRDPQPILTRNFSLERAKG